MRGASRSIRKLPLVLSFLILSVAAVSYALFYEHQLAYVKARNARLLAMPERTLTRTIQAGGRDLTRTFTRDGTQLVVEVSRVSATPASRKAPAGSVPFSVRLRDLLLQVPLALDAFDFLLVADDTGAVIEHVGDETLARHSLEGIATSRGVPIPMAEFWNSTLSVATELNGRPYALACHPMSLPHGVTASAKAGPEPPRRGFVFCGLTAQERMRREALCISPIVVVALMALLVLALLTPPFLKPVLLGPSERLRFSDVCMLGLSAFLALLLLPLAILDVGLFGSLHAQADNVLATVGSSVRDHFDAEVRRIQRQLAAYDRGMVGSAPATRCENLLELSEGHASGCPPVEALEYPYFESVGWANADGEQAARWWAAPRSQPGGGFPLGQREYFKAVRDGHLWPPGSDRDVGPYFVDAVRSFTSGEVRAVLSIPSSGNGRPLMAAMTTRLLSLTDPVLPPRVGFALIAHNGDVLFHSDSRLSLTHNLFEETGQDPDLRATVDAGDTAFLHGRYWGRRHRFFVTPLGQTPWTLVVFRKEDLLRAANVEVVTKAGALAVAYTLATVVPPFLTYAFALRRRGPWLWPARERGLVYLELTLALTVMAFLAARSIQNGGATRVMALAFGIPWAAWAAVFVGFRLSLIERLISLLGPRLRVRVRSAAEDRFRTTFLLASLLFCSLCTIAPGAAIAKAAADWELQALAHQERRSFAERDHRRSIGLEEFYGRRLQKGSTADRALEGRREDETLDKYEIPIFASSSHAIDRAPGSLWYGAPAPAPPGFGRLQGLVHAIQAGVPLLDPAAGELRHLPRLGVVRGVWCTGPGGESRFALRCDPEDVQQVVLSAGPWPSLWTLVGAGPALAILGILPPLLLGLRWCATRLLLADTVRPDPRGFEDLKEGAIRTALCLVPSSMEIDRLLEGGWCQRVAVLDGDVIPSGVDASRPLVVDLRDFDASPPAARASVLGYLEARVARADQPVCFLASTHPVDLLARLGKESRTATAPWPPAEVRRWLRLFDQFQTVVVRDLGRSGSEEGQAARSEQSARRLIGRPSGSPGAVRLLAAELEGAPQLRRLADRHLPSAAFEGLKHSEILGRLAEVGAGYYWALWSACSERERLALVHLCEESFVNPREIVALQQLLDRGLVVRDPALRPVNRSFARFVLERVGRQQVLALEALSDGVSWSDLQLPLVSVAAICGLLLVLSHQEMLETSVPLLSALGASGIPFFVKAVGLFKNVAGGRWPSGPDRG
jgi:hypothetical protein